MWSVTCLVACADVWMKALFYDVDDHSLGCLCRTVQFWWCSAGFCFVCRLMRSYPDA
jgi:hypothetical protein